MECEGILSPVLPVWRKKRKSSKDKKRIITAVPFAALVWI